MKVRLLLKPVRAAAHRGYAYDDACCWRAAGGGRLAHDVLSAVTIIGDAYIITQQISSADDRTTLCKTTMRPTAPSTSLRRRKKREGKDREDGCGFHPEAWR